MKSAKDVLAIPISETFIAPLFRTILVLAIPAQPGLFNR